jgi:hypothetical protein
MNFLTLRDDGKALRAPRAELRGRHDPRPFPDAGDCRGPYRGSNETLKVRGNGTGLLSLRLPGALPHRSKCPGSANGHPYWKLT